jgi:hypothetical protein
MRLGAALEIVITGLDPVILFFEKSSLRRLMDARIKSGHDERVCVATVIARSEATKQSISPQRKYGLLRFARNGGL